MIERRALLRAAAFAAPAVLSAPALAQGLAGQRPIRLIVPYPPGGSTDVLSRLYAERMGAVLGQPVVVENRAGASGNLGTDAVAKAAPDGLTIGAVTASIMAINQFLFQSMPFDPEKDLVPIGLAWDTPNVAVIAPDKNPSKTLAEFIDWAKKKPDGITYGSTGIGQTTHLSSSMLFSRTGVKATHVPYRGAAQTVPALLAGDVDIALDNLASHIGLIQEGRMRGLAVTGATRWPTLPNIPTMAEAGIPDFVISVWGAFVAPAGTPAPVIERLNNAMRQVAQDEAMQKRFIQGGAQALWTTAADAAARANRERPMWKQVVQASGARAD
ncbi:twin-arginine translocation pathway signal protein [Pseudoroseomonas rhizosphaerae]|uniref:Twin-arginine translocation pathway signal protein n=1 Tax=Teichococcus rhizosphaerae TaxID=1335062 RepID=A0A2C7AEK3_9PROT|nr:tripartite tricarboxylate transporter substrate binding protein [Pseudoroseomonas rhizosphaerae]PHK96499.1 twin-arginine translocation pathway signal protein [Pseudoroseomonas rhizosphaerae]